jgi:hypothetical protein
MKNDYRTRDYCVRFYHLGNLRGEFEVNASCNIAAIVKVEEMHTAYKGWIEAGSAFRIEVQLSPDFEPAGS